jgi:hypothetical protein
MLQLMLNMANPILDFGNSVTHSVRLQTGVGISVRIIRVLIGGRGET